MKLNYSLLEKLYRIEHESQEEGPMQTFIINFCSKIPNVHIELDSFRNLFITRNTNNLEFVPCIVAHTDCVYSHSEKNIIYDGTFIYGEDPKTGYYLSLGMDDSNGIYAALTLLQLHHDIKICFTVEEEVGFIGAKDACVNINFFKNVSYLIQADRHGGNDLITETNGIYSASKKWLNEITPLLKKYKYKEAIGTGTDIGVMARTLHISGVNISCGYYSEHTNQEYTVVDELLNCVQFMHKILLTVPLNCVYDISASSPSYSTFKYYDENDCLPCDTCTHMDCLNCNKFNDSYSFGETAGRY